MGKTNTAVSKALPNKLPKKGFGHYLKRDIYLYLLLVLPVAYFIIFKYVPMYGIVIAFKEYNIFEGVFASPWIGWDAFREVFKSDDFYRALKNTFLLNGFDMIFGFPAPIILAIIINEVRSVRYKRISQTMLYLPHFLSWVIIGGIALQIFAPNFGMIDTIIKSMGFKTIPFLTEKWHWLATYTGIGIWQSAGWGMIIYLAAITGIPAELYEAADVDGAGRLRKIWCITLPAIKPTIIILFILNIGKISMIGFDRPYILGNQQVKDFSDVISTYVYRVGLQSSRYNIATAVGLFQSIVGLVFLSVTNWLANKSGEQGIW